MSKLQTFVFLELPIEVRDMIYELLLVHKDARKSYELPANGATKYSASDNPWMLNTARFKAVEQSEDTDRIRRRPRLSQPAVDASVAINSVSKYELYPAILRTNSHVHAEASKTLYSKNYFKILFEQENRSSEIAIFKHTYHLHIEVPAYYLRLMTRAHLVFKCGDLQGPRSNKNAQKWLTSMEMTVNETAEALKHNKLKELAVVITFGLRLRRLYLESPGNDFMGLAKLCKDVITPISKLVGVEKAKVYISLANDPYYPNDTLKSLKKGDINKTLATKMMSPRSVKEEEARLAGWKTMGYTSPPTNYDMQSNSELIATMVKRGIHTGKMRARKQWLKALTDADLADAAEKEKKDEAFMVASASNAVAIQAKKQKQPDHGGDAMDGVVFGAKEKEGLAAPGADVKQHILTNLKNLYNLAKKAGMPREEFLGLMDLEMED